MYSKYESAIWNASEYESAIWNAYEYESAMVHLVKMLSGYAVKC